MIDEKLALYKICCTSENEYDSQFVDELGWVSDTEFCVWVSYLWIKEFIEEITKLFGYGIFDDGAFDANMQSNCVCIDLCKALGYCIDIEEVFPKEKYEH